MYQNIFLQTKAFISPLYEAMYESCSLIDKSSAPERAFSLSTGANSD